MSIHNSYQIVLFSIEISSHTEVVFEQKGLIRISRLKKIIATSFENNFPRNTCNYNWFSSLIICCLVDFSMFLNGKTSKTYQDNRASGLFLLFSKRRMEKTIKTCDLLGFSF